MESCLLVRDAEHKIADVRKLVGCPTSQIGVAGSRVELNHGLKGTVVDGYFADDMGFVVKNFKMQHITNFFSDITDGTNLNTLLGENKIEKQYYTVVWAGFFRPRDYGEYTMHLNSKDASYMWMGDPCDNPLRCGFMFQERPDRFIIRNGGIHPPRTVSSGPMTLDPNMYYPLVIIYGQNSPDASIVVSYSFHEKQITMSNRFEGLWFATAFPLR